MVFFFPFQHPFFLPRSISSFSCSSYSHGRRFSASPLPPSPHCTPTERGEKEDGGAGEKLTSANVCGVFLAGGRHKGTMINECYARALYFLAFYCSSKLLFRPSLLPFGFFFFAVSTPRLCFSEAPLCVLSRERNILRVCSAGTSGGGSVCSCRVSCGPAPSAASFLPAHKKK